MTTAIPSSLTLK